MKGMAIAQRTTRRDALQTGHVERRFIFRSVGHGNDQTAEIRESCLVYVLHCHALPSATKRMH